MPDSHLRNLQRRFQQSGSPEDELGLLEEAGGARGERRLTLGHG